MNIGLQDREVKQVELVAYISETASETIGYNQYDWREENGKSKEDVLPPKAQPRKRQ